MRTLQEEIDLAKSNFEKNKVKFDFKMNWDLYLLGWLQSAWVFAKDEFDELKEEFENETNK